MVVLEVLHQAEAEGHLAALVLLLVVVWAPNFESLGLTCRATSLQHLSSHHQTSLTWACRQRTIRRVAAVQPLQSLLLCRCCSSLDCRLLVQAAQALLVVLVACPCQELAALRQSLAQHL